MEISPKGNSLELAVFSIDTRCMLQAIAIRIICSG